MELDPINFSDEAFYSYVSIKPQIVMDGDGVSPNKRKMKNAEVLTEELTYKNAETNTKYKKEAISVS